MRLPSYVLITPVRNEQAYIEKTMQSMVSQTITPRKWVIVNDASTDGTEEIIRRYLPGNPWIELIRMPEQRDRSFSAKVQCFNAGYARLKGLDYGIIGNLDGDVSFDAEYLEYLLGKFTQDPRLGVAGTPFVEDNGYSSLGDSFEGAKHVAGGCQLFRRECFEEIGGYVANKAGGVDWIAVTTARMKGWKTQSFKEKVFYHHKSLGTGESNRIASAFNYGRKDYYLGNHPLWESLRLTYRLKKKPYITGSLLTASGYLWALITRMKRPISNELVRFHREEEMQKLRAILKQVLMFKKADPFKLDY